MYRYSLDKSSRKFTCPFCQKKTFVKYFDSYLNEYLPDHFGRCDRESNCRYHNMPKQGVKDLYFNQKKRIELPISLINISEVSKHGSNFDNNNFISFLRQFFTLDEVKNTILKYCIGSSDHWEGATIFWQINEVGNIHTGKVMLFDRLTGKRIKSPYSHINWMHKILKIKNFSLKQCLFGLHLVNEFPNHKIGIVESEKTAIIMSLLLPNYIWLATGSKSNLKEDLLKPIKNRNLVVFPDKSEYLEWKEKTNYLKINGYKIRCSNLIESKNVNRGYDLADYYIDFKNKKLELTETEKVIKKIAAINPFIINFIKEFELVDKYHNDIINID